MTLPVDDRPPDPRGPPAAKPGTDSRSPTGMAFAGPAEAAATLSPDTVLAARYRIVRFIAVGGMGEVYEAEDLDLRDHIALKTIRPEIAHDARALERFKREILLARKVTHPNVARTFDIGHHATREGAGLTFLTMELLRGETLASHLQRCGRMTAAEAAPIVSQMVSGLGAAHRAAVVHRDFKPANVVLVPEGGGLGRAVVTDFGLARSGPAGAGDETAGSGLLMGTAAYMAPEQVEGGAIGPATDIYALGITLYEMVTGRRPFVGETALSTAAKRLTEAPPPPHLYAPDIEPAWERVILRCLEREPAARFADVEDVARALEEKSAPGTRRVGQRRLMLAAAALVVLATGVATARLIRRQRPAVAPTPAVRAPALPAPPASLRRSVAVLGFRNLSGRAEAEWLSTALAEMLTTELAAGETLRTIPGENVVRAKADLALGDADSLAVDTLAKVRALLGADVVVLGSYLALGEASGGKIRLDLRMQDAAIGETIAAGAETGTEAQLFDLVSRTGALLRGKLGLGGLSAADAGAVRAARPASAEAARFYAEGLARLRIFDALAARERLEKAVAADPALPLAHAALAEAWARLGYDAKAREEAKRAFDLAAGLSREDRLVVEARYRETTREWGKAVEAYRTLFGFFPDNVEYGLRLAADQSQGGSAQDALATVEALRKLPPPARNDLRIDLAEAQAAMTLSDFKRQLAAAERAAAKAQAEGARLALARALLLESWSLSNLGQPEKAVAASDEGRRLFHEAGARVDEANATLGSGFLAYGRGDRGLARRRMEEGLAVFREIGHRRGQGVALQNMTVLLLDEGDLARGRRQSEQALDIYREVGDRKSVGMMLNNLGLIHLLQGDLAGALKMYGESVALLRELGVKNEVARGLINTATVQRRLGDLAAAIESGEAALAAWRETSADKRLAAYIHFDHGGLLAARGDLVGARKSYDEALAICRQTGNKSYTAYVLGGLGELLAAQGDLPAARKSHEEALALRRELGERSYLAESTLHLAALDLEEGRAREAEAAARTAAEEFAREGREGSNTSELGTEAGARLLLARTLLAQRRTQEALREIGLARALLARSPSRCVALTLEIAAARALGAPRAADALVRLETVVADAVKTGFVGVALDARLAQAEIEMRSGRAAEGRAHLETLEAEAKARGFGLLKRGAAAVGAGALGRS